MQTETKETREQRLTRLGLKTAAEQIPRARKLARAYEHFRYVTDPKINAFRAKLREESETGKRERHGDVVHYKSLVFTPLDRYPTVPPDDVLARLEAVQAMKIFDRFEVAKIEWIEEVKDPILFGRIDGCEDRFYVAQWMDDVKISDLIGEDEG